MAAAITAPEASVIVGAFVLAGGLVQTLVSARATRKTIGRPNGKGNVVEMLESLLTRQANILAAVDSLMTRHDKLVNEVDVVKQNLLNHMDEVKRKPTTPRKRTVKKDVN